MPPSAQGLFARRGGEQRPLVQARIATTYIVLGLVLFAYLVSLIVRPAGSYSTLVDGWMVDGFELILCLLAFARAIRADARRALPLALGGAMLAWTLGDVALTVESLGGATPSTPSVADGFYLAFYPFAYLALVLLMRRGSSKLVPATWLDGGIAGLGAAALCAAFAFESIERLAGGGGVSVATGLAYPIGDVLLLAMVVGGSAIVAGAGRRAWWLVATGCGVNAVGDTFALFPGPAASHLGSVVCAIAWPIALLMMSIAVWVRPAPLDVLAIQPAPGFLLPGLGGAAGLTVVLVASVGRVDLAAIALAAATLVLVGARLVMSLGSLRRLTEARHRQAITDQLTGLGNRRRIADVLDGFFAETRESPVDRHIAFLFVDLDRFKEVNDSFGHAAGDQLLVQLGPRFRDCLGASDLLVRIGGDELAVILVDGTPERAAATATQLSSSLDRPFILDTVSVLVGASIGIAFAPDHATDATELMRCADKAMYRSKRDGSSFEIYDAEQDVEHDRLSLANDLRVAIDERRIELYFQPQLDLRDGTILSVEALARWLHPRLGPIPPLSFLPLAEEAGLMRPLTELVLDLALAQCSAWRARGQIQSVAVNVSATNVLDADFSALVRKSLARHGLRPESLVLEITETTVIADFDRCKLVTEQLTALGCLVSIDDFGAGFTSLSYLSRLAIGELKLDRTLVTRLTDGDDDARDAALVEATIDLAHALGLRVVAEGIEDAATLEILRRLDCDLAQGYQVGRPAPAGELWQWDEDIAA
jgi:diguanylate cyclase